MAKTIILIHGLFMNKCSMYIMAIKLKKQGYNIDFFEYDTTQFDAEKTYRRLNELIIKLGSKEIYLIGHSMGGLVARMFVTHYPRADIKKIITIATPHNGSHVAKFLITTKLSFLLGNCGDSGIIKVLPEWNNICALGCIVAISKIGINNLLSSFHGKDDSSDGNVFVEEAILKNSTDKVYINATHTGVLLSNDVITQCISFIENNQFSTTN